MWWKTPSGELGHLLENPWTRRHSKIGEAPLSGKDGLEGVHHEEGGRVEKAIWDRPPGGKNSRIVITLQLVGVPGNRALLVRLNSHIGQIVSCPVLSRPRLDPLRAPDA